MGSTKILHFVLLHDLSPKTERKILHEMKIKNIVSSRNVNIGVIVFVGYWGQRASWYLLRSDWLVHIGDHWYEHYEICSIVGQCCANTLIHWVIAQAFHSLSINKNKMVQFTQVPTMLLIGPVVWCDLCSVKTRKKIMLCDWLRDRRLCGVIRAKYIELSKCPQCC